MPNEATPKTTSLSEFFALGVQLLLSWVSCRLESVIIMS